MQVKAFWGKPNSPKTRPFFNLHPFVIISVVEREFIEKERIFFQGITVLDPDREKDYLERIQNRTKERKYHFDHAFGPECTNTVCWINIMYLNFVVMVSYSCCIF